MTHGLEPITSHEAVTAARPVVESSPQGAEALAASYWREVEATTQRLVRANAVDGSIDLHLFGQGPALFRLGPPAILAGLESVTCTYPIVGGLLVGRPGGELALEQLSGNPVVLRSTLTEYVPRFAGALYYQVQARIHSLIARRFFARLVRDAQ